MGLQAGCSQYGFAVVDSTGQDLHVLYFEEFSNKTNTTAAYDAILSCVKAKGVGGCSRYADVWLNRPDK